MPAPLVSILVPTYNYARYLPEALESILAQDFCDFEVIVADDASTDNTPELCRAFAQRDERIRFVQHAKNLGMVENWNWCLTQARGTLVKFMLADDCFKQPQALRRMVDAIEQNPGVSLVASARQLLDERSREKGLWNPLGLRSRRMDGRRMSVRCLEQNLNLIGEPSAVLFRREDAARGFDSSFRQLVDLEMWLHLLRRGDLMYLKEPLCCFRQHAGQQTEVNRECGLHLQEMVRLGGYMPGGRARRMHFRWLYQMRKIDPEGYADSIRQVRSGFSPVVYGFSWLEYKICRPFYNLRKSLLKRSGSARE